MYEGVKGGLSAELLRNRGFEEAANAIGLSRHWERYPDDRNDDYGLSFAWDDAVAYPVSARATSTRSPSSTRFGWTLSDGIVERHGLLPAAHPGARRDRLPRVPVAEDDRLRRAHRGGARGGPVRRCDVCRGGDPGRPGRLEAVPRSTLRPARADAHARLAILFEGTGRVWVDQVSLLPGDAVGGVRADVEARVAALRPAFIRWPGGNVAQDYHWAWGVGPRDGRPVWVNLSWKNEPEPGDIGTDEFIAFCRRVGAEPSITVNVEGRGATAEEAAAWVEYCNGPATSRYGAMRAANGHPEPYGVKYWELGNEIWGDWVRGHSDAADLRAQLPSATHRPCAPWTPRIQLIAVGDNDMGWNRTVLRAAGAVDRLPGDPPLLRAQGDGRGRAQPHGAAAPLRAVLQGGREARSARRRRAARSGSTSTSGGSTCPRPASTRWRRRSTGRGS